MRRTHIVLLPAFLALSAVACGGGGKGGSGPPGGYTHENGSRPVVNGWDPFAPAQDPSPSGTDFPECTGDQTITPSQLIDAVLLPMCNMAATCGGGTTTTPTPTPDTPQPGTSSGMSTRDLGTGTPPSYCEDIYGQLDLEVEDGFSGLCDVFQQVSDALKRYPECNPPVVVPAGLCMSALSACISDIVAMGCNPSLDTPPRSCSGISFGSSDSSGSGGSGGGGGNGDGGGGGGVNTACQDCLTGCNGDNNCMTDCFQTGPCSQGG